MAYVDDPNTQRANMTFIKTSMKEPLLEREHEFELAKAWRQDGSEEALHELIRSYTRLVIALASRFRNYGLPMGDLIQEGNVGLMQAAARFEPEREVRFSTYASWWIRSSMQDYVLRNWSIVRTGTTAAQKALFFNLRRLKAKIEGKDGEALSDAGRAKIATDLNVNKSDVIEMELRLAGADQSLNAPLKEESDGEWQDFLPDQRPNPEDVVQVLRDNETRSRWLAEALSELSPREQRIISERRLGDEAVTLEMLGKELGISKERVRQLEQRAMSKLKASIERKVDDPADLFA
jgi:RNA polymerase sigma-32 factor